MKFTAEIASIVLAATSVTAAPSAKRATEISCDSFGSKEAGAYTIYHNNWGAAQATSGKQCTSFDSIDGATVAWETSWNWQGGSTSVKSYSNAAVENVGKQLSAVKSIPSTWKWTYSNTDIVADVSYDLWLAPTQGGTNSYEIMVWLAAYGGAGPISSTGSAIATPTIGSTSFKLFEGPNGDTTVYSFVADSPVEDFSGDMLDFLTYLVQNQGVSDSNWITSLQAGTEPFTGSETVFKTTAYSLTIS